MRERRSVAPEDDRDSWIPVRKPDLVAALATPEFFPGDGDRTRFARVCDLLAAIFHFEYFARLETLKNSYFHFNPDLPPQAAADPAAIARAYEALETALVETLTGANFVEVTAEEIARAHAESALVRVRLKVPAETYRAVRFFRRGRRQASETVRAWFGLRRREITFDVYENVVALIAFKDEAALDAKTARRLGRTGHVRPGAVLLKYFRNIPAPDLNALYPDVKVSLSLIDKAMLGVPALAGGIPILINLIPALSVLALVIGFYLGIVGTIEDDKLKQSVAALSGLVALGGFLMRQWVKYERQSLKYQKLIADTVYYRNVNNNAGLFDYVIGAAEEQECKEAFLAYAFLSRGPATRPALDAAIETFLKDRFGIDIDFEVGDGLAKLGRLGLLTRAGETLTVLPPGEALVALDARWDAFFPYADEAAGT